ncbi:MAG TPA: DmsC/YnfH family molybdoenzyme membrane anchor subunit [Polyangia bacterium]|nr:DmsC/YnfH family molybdoenzyme membrane anchor subunit [Polyangia bacterium]
MIRSSLLQLAPPSRPAEAVTPLELVLAEQQRLTAVERFARAHERGLPATGDGHTYRDLIPLTRPAPGQQYAFEVDMDLCTGCKACVTGCHNLNGLDDTEVWRSVGLLHGGTSAAPVQQTVTTACHHCLDPACMNGCPVKAYEKDPVTGIVKHLDDQCIGCQYCVFMCPYDAPKFNKERGIVRKCDMCSDRLAHDEAPACVQSCPNEAIRITLVQREEVVQATEANNFLPGAPTPHDTLPTTVYKTARVFPRNMLPANFYSVSPEHAHLPLVVMLTLTQLAVGAFIANMILGRLLGTLATRGVGFTNVLFALALALGAMGASSLHLGRPQYAFRAVLGLRRSWMSREIVALGAFAFAGLAYAGCVALGLVAWAPRAAAVAAGAGIAGVVCSVMVYAATKREHWRGSLTGLKFGLTTLVLGLATVLMVTTVAALVAGGAGAAPFSSTPLFRQLGAALGISTLVKLGFELSILRHVRDPHHSVLKRSALLMLRDLRRVTLARFVCGALGGLALPALALGIVARAVGAPPPLVGVLTIAIFLLCLAGELCERYLFFAAAPPSKMPGGLT